MREYLAALEANNPVKGAADDDSADPPAPPKNISLTDPSARYTAAPGGPAFFAYSTNFLSDLKAGIIVAVEATPAHRTQEVESTRAMIERVQERFGLRPKRLVGDIRYGTEPMVDWMVNDKKIAPHVPLCDKSERSDGTFGRSAFTFDVEGNYYVCPNGMLLRPSSRKHTKHPHTYRASQFDCQNWSLKSQCCPNMSHRNIRRSRFEPARDVARQIATTSAYRQSRKDRKKVEMLFAHLKRILEFDRLRLRGPCGAHDEFLMAATAQNLR